MRIREAQICQMGVVPPWMDPDTPRIYGYDRPFRGAQPFDLVPLTRRGRIVGWVREPQAVEAARIVRVVGAPVHG